MNVNKFDVLTRVAVYADIEWTKTDLLVLLEDIEYDAGVVSREECRNWCLQVYPIKLLHSDESISDTLMTPTPVCHILSRIKRANFHLSSIDSGIYHTSGYEPHLKNE